MIARLMREGFGASVNTCKTCSIRARLLCFYLRRERNTSFWHCWWSTFSSERKFSLHSPFFYSLENGQSCSGMDINDLLSFISFFVLSFFCLFSIFHPSYFHLIIFHVQMLTNALTSLLRVDLELNALT